MLQGNARPEQEKMAGLPIQRAGVSPPNLSRTPQKLAPSFWEPIFPLGRNNGSQPRASFPVYIVNMLERLHGITPVKLTAAFPAYIIVFYCFCERRRALHPQEAAREWKKTGRYL